jgi:hypothetical protein
MSPEQIRGAMVEERYNAATHTHDQVIVCPLCKEHAPGSCDYTMLHRVIAATPMFSRQVREEHNNEQSPAGQQPEGQQE